jgi:hypothetical protein
VAAKSDAIIWLAGLGPNRRVSALPLLWELYPKLHGVHRRHLVMTAFWIHYSTRYIRSDPCGRSSAARRPCDRWNKGLQNLTSADAADGVTEIAQIVVLQCGAGGVPPTTPEMS